VRICELEKAAIEHQSVEKCIELERKLDPNCTEEKSKALYQRKEAWLKESTERLNEARANPYCHRGTRYLVSPRNLRGYCQPSTMSG